MSETLEVSRPTHDTNQDRLFDVPEDWRQEWWGMPEFVMEDARPQFRVVVNFFCWEDVSEFADRLEISVSPKTDSVWFPKESVTEPKEWVYDDEGSL